MFYSRYLNMPKADQGSAFTEPLCLSILLSVSSSSLPSLLL